MVRCKDCKRSTRNPRAKCWQKHQMCGPCAYKHFPNEYEKKVSGKGGTWLGDRTIDLDIKEIKQKGLVPNNNTFLIQTGG